MRKEYDSFLDYNVTFCCTKPHQSNKWFRNRRRPRTLKHESSSSTSKVGSQTLMFLVSCIKQINKALEIPLDKKICSLFVYRDERPRQLVAIVDFLFLSHRRKNYIYRSFDKEKGTPYAKCSTIPEAIFFSTSNNKLDKILRLVSQVWRGGRQNYPPFY